MREIYLDNSATTRTDPDVAEIAASMMLENYGNPSSLHRKGLQAQLSLDHARGQVAAGMGCTPGEVLFTSGGTEANNLALLGAARAAKRRGKTIVSTKVEHASVLEALRHLQGEGFVLKLVAPGPGGSPDPEELAAAVDEDTVLVSCMLVNSEVGAVLPVASAARLIRRRNPTAVIHCDGVQAFGKLPVSVEELGVDLFTASAHKLHAPKGCGALYLRKGVRLSPLLYGGAQENGLRAGTENTPLACAFGYAVEKALSRREASWQRAMELYEHFVNIGKTMPEICINSPDDGTPYICNISVPGYRSEILLHFLEDRGIYVSSGSACSKGAKSHVLTAMGLPPRRIDSALRVSFSRDNTTGEIDAFWEALRAGVATLLRSR